MIQLLLVLVFNSLFILGLHYSLQYDEVDGEIFNQQVLWPVRYWAVKLLGEYWSKPIGGCLVCMAGLWSLPVYFYYYDSLLLWFLYVPALAGVNRILVRLI